MGVNYKRKKVEENPERDIVLGMVVSDEFLRDVQSIIRIELIETPYILTVVNWCLKYYEQYEKAPNIHIEDIYKKEVELGNLDEDQEELINQLLESLSNEYERAEQFNIQYLLDKTEKHFEIRNLTNKISNIKNFLDRGDASAAQDELNGYERIALPTSRGLDPFTDSEGMRKAFEHSSEPIFKLPGVVGYFLNDLFTRDSFVTFLGPEKRGKTWMLIEMSMWARRAGLNVAFFSAGDMTLPQMQVRYGVRFTGRSHKRKYCGELKVPCLDCRSNQEDTCDSDKRVGSMKVIKEKGELMTFEEAEEHIPCTYCLTNKIKPTGPMSAWYNTRPPVEILTWQEAIKAGVRLDRRWGKKSKLLLSAYTNGTLSVDEMRNQLDLWEREQGFIPDVIIIDYMDLLTQDKGGTEFRHQTNKIWADTRGLSQERHCLVLSASQSDSASYYTKWITMKNFSEDKRKFSHVTGTITLNQLPEEKARGLMRLGKLAIREDDSNEKDYVTILQSLAMGKPILNSF